MDKKIKVVLGSDHGGFDYKTKLIEELRLKAMKSLM